MSLTSQEEAVADFATRADPYRQELLAYCYRMLGSVGDAEDEVQETMLRAWRAYSCFEGRSSLRTWAVPDGYEQLPAREENRRRRPLPSDLSSPAADPVGPLASIRPEISWLQCYRRANGLFYTDQSAWVGDMRAARRAGSSPASPPMRTAAPIPPAQAMAGMTTAQPRAWA
jgi:hypothetical protein